MPQHLDVHHHGRPVLVALLLEPVRRRDEVPRPEHPPQVEAEELTELGVIDRRQGERGPVRGRLDELHLAPFEADEPFRLSRVLHDLQELLFLAARRPQGVEQLPADRRVAVGHLDGHLEPPQPQEDVSCKDCIATAPTATDVRRTA